MFKHDKVRDVFKGRDPSFPVIINILSGDRVWSYVQGASTVWCWGGGAMFTKSQTTALCTDSLQNTIWEFH